MNKEKSMNQRVYSQVFDRIVAFQRQEQPRESVKRFARRMRLKWLYLTGGFTIANIDAIAAKN